MARSAIILDVVIASPSDVLEERNCIELAIQSWNATNSRKEGVYLQPRRWEVDTYSTYSSSPQDAINSQIIDDADILLATFWTRVGTPSKSYASGTLEEIDRFISTNKHVGLYFCEKSIPYKYDRSQIDKLEEYRIKIEKQFYYKTYENTDELANIIKHDLTQIVHKNLQSETKNNYLPLVDLSSLRHYENKWPNCYEIHKGSYIVYNVLQIDPTKIDSDSRPVKVAAALLTFETLTDRGIKFNWINPFKMEGESFYREFSMAGIAKPLGEHFLCLYGDQLDEIKPAYGPISAIIQYSPAVPPPILQGQLLTISRNLEKNIYRVASTGLALKFIGEKPKNVNDLYGSQLGIFNIEELPEAIQEKIPKIYSR